MKLTLKNCLEHFDNKTLIFRRENDIGIAIINRKRTMATLYSDFNTLTIYVNGILLVSISEIHKTPENTIYDIIRLLDNPDFVRVVDWLDDELDTICFIFTRGCNEYFVKHFMFKFDKEDCIKKMKYTFSQLRRRKIHQNILI